MNLAESALSRVAKDLDDLSARWALVGGFAVAALVEPRFTRAVDIAVSVAGDSEAESLVFDLSERGYRVGSVVEHEAGDRLATARLSSPASEASAVFVDLLFASSGIEAEIVSGAQRIEVLPGLHLPVMRLGHLIAVKLLAVSQDRPYDAIDLDRLREVADETALADASGAVELITERGYDRGRDLRAALDMLLR